MQLQGHPDGWNNNFVQQVHVGKYPLVSSCDPEVTFEEGMQPVQKGIQAAKQSRCCGVHTEFVTPLSHQRPHLLV